MKSKFIKESFNYDGSQLRPLFAYLDHGLLGDSVISWIGACDVSFDHMLDGEDLLQRSPIRGAKMLHFIVEKFDIDLFGGVALQRLMSAIVMDVLKAKGQKEIAQKLRRDGDDIFAEDRKLSISIATPSVRSCLIHFAVNINNENTPVKTLSLEDLKVEPQSFAEEVMKALTQEITTIQEATWKVKSV